MDNRIHLNRNFKSCSATCHHSDAIVRRLITECRNCDSISLDAVNACNSICFGCHFYIED